MPDPFNTAVFPAMVRRVRPVAARQRALPGQATDARPRAVPSPGAAACWPRRPPKDIGGEVMTKRVGVTLRLQRVNSIVRSSSGPGQFMLWDIGPLGPIDGSSP
jgi:hypothetical protein